MEEFDKKYYKIKDVSELLGVSASTLRYWEQEFLSVVLAEAQRTSDTTNHRISRL